MHQKIILILFTGFVMIGCGGGGSGSTGTISPLSLDLSQDIADGKIAGYDTGDPIQDQYLAVINYLRSLHIQCDDPMAVTGPSSPSMSWSLELANAAEEHSSDMQESVHYAHDGSGTVNDITGQTFTPTRASTYDERIARNGFSGLSIAENIAMSASTPTAPPANQWIKVMEGWMTSTHGHCSNIMNPALSQVGMYESRAAVDAEGWYKVYWTQDFGG